MKRDNCKLLLTILLCWIGWTGNELLAQNANALRRAEYFFDTDPGAGNGVALTAQDGQFNQAVEKAIAQANHNLSVGTHTLQVRMMGADSTWGPLFRFAFQVSSLSSPSMNLTQGEYFFDTDPGTGSATVLLAADGQFNQAFEAIAQSQSASALSVGNHTLQLRLKDSNGNWGPLFRFPFSVKSNGIDTISVSYGEYYVDQDPGIGLANPLLAADGQFNQALESVIQTFTGSPSNGPHVIGVRLKDGKGFWGPAFTTSFLIRNVYTDTVRVLQGEFFVDTDPGAGNASPLLALDGNFNAALETIYSNLSNSYSTGVHSLQIRLKDAKGNWGPLFKTTFQSSAIYLDTVSVISGEYFLNADPGIGQATPLLALDGNLNNAVESVYQNISSGWNTGLNQLNIRLRDRKGNWGPVFKSVFNLRSVYADTVKVVSGECFFDNDPGIGSGIPVTAVDGNINQALEQVYLSQTSALSNGSHTFSVRLRDGKGNWGPTYKHSFQVTAGFTASIKISSGEVFFDTDPGVGQGTPLVAVDGQYNQAWERAALSPLASLSTGAHSIHVRFRDSAGNWSPKFSTVIVVNACNTLPVVSMQPVGKQTICNGDSVVLIASATGSGLTYRWRKNGLMIPGATTSTYAVRDSGIYDVVVTNSSGCSAGSLADTILVSSPNTLPGITIQRSLANPICANQSVVFTSSITNGGNAPVITWYKNGNVVATGDSFMLATPANQDIIYASLYSNAFCLLASTVNASPDTLRVNPLPGAAGMISGNTTPNAGSLQTYGISTVSNATSYQWVVPSGWTIQGTSGSNSISVTVGVVSGTISVTPVNACGNGTTAQLSVSAITLPGNPGPITGPDSVCSGTQAGYKVAPGSFATSHQWSIPSRWTLLSGQGTDSITVLADTSRGTVTVRAVNSFGNSATLTKSVWGKVAPTGGSLSGPNFATLNSISSWALNGVSPTTVNYNWTITGAASVTGTGKTRKPKMGNQTIYLSVFASRTDNGCPGKVFNDSIRRLSSGTPVTISALGPTQICSPSTVVLSANNPQSYALQWQKNTINLSNQTGGTYTASASVAKYRVIAFDGTNYYASNIIGVNQPAAVTASKSKTLCRGDSLVLSVNTNWATGYQWIMGTSTILTGDTFPSLKVLNGGNYTCKVKYAGGCEIKSAVSKITLVTCKMADESQEMALKVWPNPSNGFMKVSLNSSDAMSEVYRLNVYDIQGKLVAEWSTLMLNAGEAEELDLSDLPDGHYELVFENERASQQVQIIVNH